MCSMHTQLMRATSVRAELHSGAIARTNYHPEISNSRLSALEIDTLSRAMQRVGVQRQFNGSGISGNNAIEHCDISFSDLTACKHTLQRTISVDVFGKHKHT